MQIFNKKLDLQSFLTPLFQEKKSVGLVPTMGALHKGHLSLMQKALEENDQVVVSVFVNPTQFNNAEDLEKYPRNLERDVATIASLSDKIVLFAPEISEMYEGTPTSQNYDFQGLDKVMEGAFRAGHFRRETFYPSDSYPCLLWRKRLSANTDYQEHGRPARITCDSCPLPYH